MSRLAAEGEIVRVRKGVYWMDPKTRPGMPLPRPIEIALQVAGPGSGPAGVSTQRATPGHLATLIFGLVPKFADDQPMTYIVQRQDRFYVVAYDGVDPLSGKERRRWHPVGRDRAEAEAVRRRLEPASVDQRPLVGGPTTVATFLNETWLPRKRHQVRATTEYRYAWFIEHYINPAIGDVPLRRLRVDHLEALYQQLAVTGGRHGAGLAPKTILEVHMIVRAALGLAADRHLVVSNVAARAQLKLSRREGRSPDRGPPLSWPPSWPRHATIVCTRPCTSRLTAVCAAVRSLASNGATSTPPHDDCRSGARCNASVVNPSSSASRPAPADAPSNSTEQP